MIYSCCNENRKSAVLKSATLNGIDYLSRPGRYRTQFPRQRTLLIRLKRSPPH
jgi:hypothetical protein